MKIRLADYKEGVPTAVHEQYDPKALDLEFVDLKYSSPLEMNGTVEKGPDTLTFRGRLTSDIRHICARCLKSVSDHSNQAFELFYEIREQEFIETLDDLREAMLLSHLLSFVCSESCRGLCPECGANRNETPCGCAAKGRSHNPFSLLNKLKKKEETNRG